MPKVTENDLKELKVLITQMGEQLSRQMTSLEAGQKSLEQGQIEIKEQISELDKRLTVIESRLEYWKPSMNIVV